MKAEKAAHRSTVYTRLDTIRMSEAERRHANSSLRKGELIVALVLRVAADLRAIARSVERAVVSLAGGIRATFARPLKP